MANDEAGFGTTIKCPGCGEGIPISEAIHHQIAERTRQEFKAEALEAKRLLAARERELDEKWRPLLIRRFPTGLLRNEPIYRKRSKHK